MSLNPIREARPAGGNRSLLLRSLPWLVAATLAARLTASSTASAEETPPAPADETPPPPGSGDSDAPPVPPPPGAAPASVPLPPSAPVVVTTAVATPSAAAPEGEMLRWAGTRFDWYHGVTLATLGVHEAPSSPGLSPDRSAYGPNDDFYAQSFTFSGGFFILERPPHQLRASTAVNVQTELTNSDDTTKKRDPQLNDIPLRLTYTPTLASIGDGGPIKGAAALYDPTLLGRGDYRTWGILSGSVGFPTSSRSQGIGRLLTTSLSAGARQQIKLLGSDAPGLTHAIFGVAGGWTHYFHKASTPVNSNVQTPRQSGGFTPIVSDQLRPNALVENTLGVTATVVLSLYAGLQLESSLGWGRQIPYSFKGSPCEVVLQVTGCVDLPETEPKARDYTSFALDLSYLVIPELAVAFGYENTAQALKLNGRSRDPFFSSNSQFYAGISLSFDRFYQRFAEPENLAALLGEEPTARTD